MFVSCNSLSGKPLSKLSCVCLPLGKLVNGKHFLVNGKQFPVKKNWFGFQESVFPFGCVCFPESDFRKPLSKLSYVCLPLEKLVNGKHFPVKEKFGLVFRKVFS
jgi:hypothetical protein